MTNKEKVSAALRIIQAIAEAIREVGTVPSGHLYATLCGRLSLTDYEFCIGRLKSAGLVSESANVLRWIGPTN